MSTVFGHDYANVYDALYRAKDYSGEADLIDRLLARYGHSGPQKILDAGCGTGNHALLLAGRGHDVTGIDRSTAMLDLAREKAAALPRRPHFVEADICDFALGTQFDAVLMMFTVLGYLSDDAEMDSALKSARNHLKPGGLFIFDVWNGLAVLAQKPEQRTAIVDEAGARIVRKTSARLEAGQQIVHVHFDMERNGPSGAVWRWAEDHAVRFFFPDELESALSRNGFHLLDLRRFPDAEAPPDEKAWNIVGIAQAM